MNVNMKLVCAALSGIAIFAAGCAMQETAKPEPAPRAEPAPTPQPAPTPAPAAKPAPKKPAVVTLSSTELFDFNKATLTERARAKLDQEVLGRLNQFGSIRYINVNGHTDRLGTPQYNQKLSEKRAMAVKAYLVSKGADASKIEVYGFGKIMQVRACPDNKNRAKLIECLAANRRVEVEIQGAPK